MNLNAQTVFIASSMCLDILLPLSNMGLLRRMADDGADQERKTKEQQKRHSTLLKTAQLAVQKLHTEGNAAALLLPLEKQNKTSVFFMSISPAGNITNYCSKELEDNETLQLLGTTFISCAKDAHDCAAKAKQALVSTGRPVPRLAAEPCVKKRKASQTTRLQASVQRFFREHLQPKGDQAFEDALAAVLPAGKLENYVDLSGSTSTV